ncbi:Sfi1 spindle body protein-domain-containing protein [Calycina marina]|uniref:Sfi1 spindle body protein-domain-containing protein n=1 Tax=Calycina marina TaxID=1763456 RepID=A0A9P7Z0F3_9HELO|nr:Sfi1 spindle body protein-domain-containing protein [Calycina marina]
MAPFLTLRERVVVTFACLPHLTTADAFNMSSQGKIDLTNLTVTSSNSSRTHGISEPSISQPSIYYSDDDFKILHLMVQDAQSRLPKLPERERLPTNALFSAYYAIQDEFPEMDADNRLARLLFKIGGLDGATGGMDLKARFVAVLEKMGIEVEFGDVTVTDFTGQRFSEETEETPEAEESQDIIVSENLNDQTEEFPEELEEMSETEKTQDIIVSENLNDQTEEFPEEMEKPLELEETQDLVSECLRDQTDMDETPEVEQMKESDEELAIEAGRQAILEEALKAWQQKKLAADKVRAQQVLQAAKDLRVQLEQEAAEIEEKRVLKERVEAWQQATDSAIFREQQEEIAIAFDREKILQEGVMAMRMACRVKIVENKINDRLKIETLYRWAIAGRLRYAERITQDRILQKTIKSCAEKAQEAQEKHAVQEEAAKQFSKQKSQGTLMRLMIAKKKRAEEQELIAKEFHEPRLLQAVIKPWHEESQQNKKMQNMADDARYYFLAWKSLRKWKTAAKKSKDDKLKARNIKFKESYARVKWMIKVNLKRIAFDVWKVKVEKILDMKAQVAEVKRNRDVIIGIEMFDKWRARSEEIAEMDVMYEEMLLRKSLKAWKWKQQVLEDLEREAVIHYQEKQQHLAMKKWSIHNLQQQGRETQADTIRDRTTRKSFKKMFTHWNQRAGQCKLVRPLDIEEAEGRSEAWSEADDDAGEDVSGERDLVPVTPVPGYLNTPSRRIERVTASAPGYFNTQLRRTERVTAGERDLVPVTPVPGYLSTQWRKTERVSAAAARFISTTPKAPLSTPIERQLRAQYSVGGIQVGESSIQPDSILLPAISRGALGKSRLGKNVGFADLPVREKKNNEVK